MKGLSQSVVAEKIKKYGKNELETKKSNAWYQILFSQCQDLLTVILVLSALVSFFLSEDSLDSLVILSIVVLNIGIGFFQEFRTERTLEALKKMVHPEIRVFRDGEEQMILTENIVPGDFVVLSEGDKVPADGVLTESHSLNVEESALTGESLPVEKKTKDPVFMGTAVVRGSGVFEVKKTGMHTKFGEIARLTTETEKSKSPLQIELQRIGFFVTKVTVVICVILFIIGIFRDYSLVQSLLFSVSVAVAAVPEGLPTTVTIALALGATVLARKKAIIKRLSSVETLGAVTTICSDKTGTLTKNEMTVRELYLADKSIFTVSGVGYDPHSGRIMYLNGETVSEENKILKNLLLNVCVRCNDSKLIQKDHRYKILGDPTEGALLTLYFKENLPQLGPKNETYYFESFGVDEVFPFDSDRKMMSVLSENKVLTKGSPDQVLKQCTHWHDGNKIHELTAEKRKQIHSHYTRMAENALRVLALAERKIEKIIPKNALEAEQKLVFLGLIGMMDPPRDTVRDAVLKCRTAGIRVIVITGDYGITAQAIAQELGIVRKKSVQVLTGDEVLKISDKELSKMLQDRDNSIIFARSLPEQKMRIVRILQEHGEIVAMTGDGVNDAPALKKADIGVAMGITGTEVSKEAATMILTNDSFTSIVTAVEEGRRIYENLKKFVWFIFSCNIGELFVIFAAILFSFPLPLTAILILCVDLGTDILPAIALGVDNAENELMKRNPRNTKEKVMNKHFVLNFFIIGCAIGVSVTVAFLYTLFGDGWHFGIPENAINTHHAMTVAFTCLVLAQLLNAFSARSFKHSIFLTNPLKNHFMLISIFSSILLVLLMLYVPMLNLWLKTVPLSGLDWWIVLLCSLVPLLAVEILKKSNLGLNRNER